MRSHDGILAKEGRRVFLVPAATEHTPHFARWRSDFDHLHLWTGARRIPAPAEFSADLERMLANNVTVVALSKPAREPVGFLQAFNFAIDFGWVFLLVYFDPRFWNHGMTTEATVLFVEYLFNAFPLRKIYMDVYEYNERVLKLLDKVGCKEEGRFEQHTWFGDKFWASIRMSLFRSDWIAQRDWLRHIIGVQQDLDSAIQTLGRG